MKWHLKCVQTVSTFLYPLKVSYPWKESFHDEYLLNPVFLYFWNYKYNISLCLWIICVLLYWGCTSPLLGVSPLPSSSFPPLHAELSWVSSPVTLQCHNDVTHRCPCSLTSLLWHAWIYDSRVLTYITKSAGSPLNSPWQCSYHYISMQKMTHESREASI